MFPPTWQYRHAGLPQLQQQVYHSRHLFALFVMSLELTILSNLVYNEKYARKVLPFLKVEYFTEKPEHKIIFLEIHEYISQYDNLPSLNALSIECQERNDLSDEQFKTVIETLDVISDDPQTTIGSLILRKSGVKNVRSTYLLWRVSRLLTVKIPSRIKVRSLLSYLKHLVYLFDQNVGHDYLDNAGDRYEFYHRKEDTVPLIWEFFNKITKGGLPNKTLNVALAGTGVGKSLFMCHVAASTSPRQECSIHYL